MLTLIVFGTIMTLVMVTIYTADEDGVKNEYFGILFCAIIIGSIIWIKYVKIDKKLKIMLLVFLPILAILLLSITMIFAEQHYENSSEYILSERFELEAQSRNDDLIVDSTFNKNDNSTKTQSTEKNIINEIKYVDDERFIVTPPSGWIRDYSWYDPTWVIPAGSEKVDKATITITIFKPEVFQSYTNPKPLTLDNIVDELHRTYELEFPLHKLTKQEIASLDNTHAILAFTDVINYADNKLVCVDVFSLHNGDFYNIEYCASNDHYFKKYMHDYEELLESFMFTEHAIISSQNENTAKQIPPYDESQKLIKTNSMYSKISNIINYDLELSLYGKTTGQTKTGIMEQYNIILDTEAIGAVIIYSTNDYVTDVSIFTREDNYDPLINLESNIAFVILSASLMEGDAIENSEILTELITTSNNQMDKKFRKILSNGNEITFSHGHVKQTYGEIIGNTFTINYDT